jgi:hypothetical protein
MKKYLLFGLIFSTEILAESFKIAGDLVEFKDQDGLLLKGCEKKCDALKVIKKHKKIDLQSIRKDMQFSNSVGSDVCFKVYKADSLLGVAENSDRRAFCYFKDKSMVEMNSLSAYLVKNKIVKE